MLKMAIKPTLQEIKSANTRKSLIDSAITLFQKYGIKKVTIDDICNNANLSKGSFYNNFSSKDHIITFAINMGLDTYISSHYSLDNNIKSKEQIISLNLCAFNFFNEIGKDMTRASYVSQISASIEVRQEGRAYVDNLDSIIRRAFEEKSFTTNFNYNEAYMHCIAVFTGILMKWCTQEKDSLQSIDWTKLITEQFRIMFK